MYSGSSQVEDEQKQPSDGYSQDQIKTAFSTSGSVQSDATPRETGPNTHNQELSPRGYASSSIQPAPRMLGLSGSIASRTSVSHNKRHTLASITSGQGVTNPSAVRMVSSWDAKGIQPKTFSLQPRSSNSGSVQKFLGSHLFKSTPQNSVAQSGIDQSVREMASTPYLQAPSRGSSGTSFRPGPLHFGSTEGGSATNVYKPIFSQYVKPYQSSYASASSGSTSSQYAQRIDGASRSSSIPTSSLASISSVFTPSRNSYGTYKPGSILGATPRQSLFTSNQGGSGSLYSQNVLATNQKPSSTTPAKSNHRQVSGQMGYYQPSYVASSGPITILYSSAQAGSSSTHVQKPSSSKAAPRQSYTPNAVKSIPSYARGPNQSIFFNLHGPTQSRTSTPQSFALVSIYNIPARYGGTHIRRLQDRIPSGRSASTSHSKTSSSVNKPQQNHTPPAKQEGPSTAYVQVSRSTR